MTKIILAVGLALGFLPWVVDEVVVGEASGLTPAEDVVFLLPLGAVGALPFGLLAFLWSIRAMSKAATLTAFATSLVLYLVVYGEVLLTDVLSSDAQAGLVLLVPPFYSLAVVLVALTLDALVRWAQRRRRAQ